MVRLGDVLATAEQLWPTAGAEPWDAVGLVVGDPEAKISKVLLAVDPVAATVEEAVEEAADLLITHHPLYLHGTTTVAASTAKGRLVTELIRGRCALLVAHTNADVMPEGPTGILMAHLGVTEELRPIVPADADPGRGIGLIGGLPESIPLGTLVGRLAETIPHTVGGIRVAGDLSMPVRTVACCSGSGGSLLEHPLVSASDVYITGDLRHHEASEAVERSRLAGGRPALVDAAHFATEHVWLASAADRLTQRHAGLEVIVSERVTDPWTSHR